MSQGFASIPAPVIEVPLPVSAITRASFEPFGTLIEPREDGEPFGRDDAQLELGGGTPRFYVMRLRHREFAVRAITRHLNVTQCLASAGGREWFLAVAPPIQPDEAGALPDPSSIKAFSVPGHVAIKLHRSAWHAGPYFHEPSADFFNLELANTNEADHRTCDLERQNRLVLRLVI